MQLLVRVVPNAKRAKVEETENGLKIWVDAPAVEGKANKRLIEILAKHFGVKKNAIRIVRGGKSREKVVAITPR
ncbi:MAG: uncharacterized protein PWP76_726 [Candidatus Diapherotrites archaeon]|nr:uncharacterized protein [Candidatus Diapherotrites archaeon]